MPEAKFYGAGFPYREIGALLWPLLLAGLFGAL